MNLPNQLISLRNALNNRDTYLLGEAAHQLAGMVAVFSTLVADVASDLEDQALAGQLDSCGPLVEKLEDLGQELVRQTTQLTIEDLRHQASSK